MLLEEEKAFTAKFKIHEGTYRTKNRTEDIAFTKIKN